MTSPLTPVEAEPVRHTTSLVASWAIVGALFGVCYHLHTIRDAIRAQTSFYLCIEMARLGGDHPSCARLLADKRLP
jgi:hypothetical protein